MRCPACGEETRGRQLNGREVRCEFCWEALPLFQPEPETKPKPVKKAPTKTKAKSK